MITSLRRLGLSMAAAAERVVLVVEPSSLMRGRIAAELQRLGHETLAARSPLDAHHTMSSWRERIGTVVIGTGMPLARAEILARSLVEAYPWLQVLIVREPRGPEPDLLSRLYALCAPGLEPAHRAA